MKTLEEIKDEYANECGRDSWDDYFKWMELCHMPLSFAQPSHDIISKRYAIEVAKQALINAADNANMLYHCGHFKRNTPTKHHQQGADNIQISKSSITDEKNIPKL